MTGKCFDTTDPVAAKLLADVQARMQVAGTVVPEFLAEPDQARYGEPRLITPRLGQGAFRLEVTDAYMRRCAITGERTLPALAACHIKPYADLGPHQVNNGLLLRSDLHNLFDLGYLTVTHDYKVKVSRRIREEFQNGRHYYELDNQLLQVLPEDEKSRPAHEFLEWHNTLFQG